MNQVFTIPHVTGYVNVLITHRLSLFENLVIGRNSAVNGSAVWTYRAEKLQLEKVEYVNMHPTMATLRAGSIPARVGMHAILISQG